MSRSVKKNPILGNALAASEKQDKQLYNRETRRKVRQCLEQGQEIVTKEHHRSGGWLFSKDGRQYCTGKVIRK